MNPLDSGSKCSCKSSVSFFSPFYKMEGQTMGGGLVIKWYFSQHISVASFLQHKADANWWWLPTRPLFKGLLFLIGTKLKYKFKRGCRRSLGCVQENKIVKKLIQIKFCGKLKKVFFFLRDYSSQYLVYHQSILYETKLILSPCDEDFVCQPGLCWVPSGSVKHWSRCCMMVFFWRGQVLITEFKPCSMASPTHQVKMQKQSLRFAKKVFFLKTVTSTLA